MNEKEDIAFLLRRSTKAGCCEFGEGREVGVSSNSIVAIAYGIIGLEKQEMPGDQDDLDACERMWKHLPEHRKTDNAKKAMERARAKIRKERP